MRFDPSLRPALVRGSLFRAASTTLTVVCLALGIVISPTAAAAPDDGSPPRFDGAWAGEIVYARGEFEFRVRVDLGPAAEGGLAGTIDIPTQRMKFYPLSEVETDGRSIEMVFTRWTERADGSGHFDAAFTFRGTLGEDGRAIEGEFKGWLVDGKDLVPFRLERIGEAGMEEAEVPTASVTDLSPASTELINAFNEAESKTRVVMLLSPT